MNLCSESGVENMEVHESSDRLKVVIIDDEDSLVEMVRDNMEMRGYTVDVALSGEEGIKKIRDVQPDAVIVDIMMPGIDGFQVLRIMKNCSETKYIPVVLMSTYDTFAEDKRGVEAEGFFRKPINISKLCETIERILKVVK